LAGPFGKALLVAFQNAKDILEFQVGRESLAAVTFMRITRANLLAIIASEALRAGRVMEFDQSD
jgi:hypothetical protein